MAELMALKQKRGQEKAVLTRTLNYFEKLKNKIPSHKVKLELELRLQKLTSAFDSYDKLQNQIETIEGEADAEEREEFEGAYFGLCAEIKDLLHNFNESQKSTNHTEETNESSNSSTSRNINPYIVPQVHLPNAKLPYYNGEYSKWVEFRDSFEALIDSNTTITEVQKLQYLKSCLSASVLETIQSIPMTAANYSLAWDTLKNRYERSQLIRQSHVKAILNLPPIVRESAKDLRKFYNEMKNNIESLRNLNEPVDQWDLILIPILVEKLDANSQKEWEKYSTLHESTTLKDLFSMLSTRCEVLEKIENNRISVNKMKTKPSQLVHLSHSSHPISCFLCKENHPIYYCPEFLKLNPKQRFDKIKKMNRCTNCLNAHSFHDCKSQSKCKKCGQTHNTLLHDASFQKRIQQNTHTENKNIELNLSNTITRSDPNQFQTLLSTAVVIVHDAFGNKHECRALLDNGAMSNFITKNLQEKLGFNACPTECTVRGIGQSTHFTNLSVSITLESKFNKFSKRINCLVMDKITSNIPAYSFSLKNISFPSNIQLADPEFNISKPIDLLLGSSVFWEVLNPNRNKLANTNLTVQNTKLGWILGGSFQIPKAPHLFNSSINCLSVNEKLENQITKFWQIDQVPEHNSIIDSQDPGEIIFQKTIKKAQDGKFIVTIPFKDNFNQLGNSKILAEKKFYSLEKRLSKNPQLKKDYSKFINEYIEMKHMTPISDPSDNEELSYYIPHHCVYREDSLTTKLRVVFNASMKSDSGLSLNDIQYPGPVIQNDLTILLINFRIHPFVMTSDISKMYRMIWLNPEQTRFHRIFWRNEPTEKLQCFELKTVTYGTASAPFLAIRCLHQLALENEEKYPEASKIIKNNFYVDDLVCGAQSEEELVKLQRNVSQILQQAGFELRKWLSNRENVYNKFSINKQLDCSILIFGEKETNKTLGIAWNAKSDQIKFFSDHQNQKNKITKRTILSNIARIFDPLGLLGPIIVIGKLIMQELWKDKISWDESVSPALYDKWQAFISNISILNSLEIPRHVILPKASYIELHGFGDASQKAYGAAIYLVSKSNDNVSAHLLISRSRVAPIKQQSLPRLELCAALLVAQLASKVLKALEIKINKSYYWSDSTIVLSWLNASPEKWKTFVANRVAEIQRKTAPEEWHHICSNENPADMLSRGCTVQQLHTSELWWHGPKWLQQQNYPIQHKINITSETDLEKRSITTAHTQISDIDIISTYSSLNRLKRVLAYCIRFVNNCKLPKSSRITGELEIQEIKKAMIVLISSEQKRYFSDEIKTLKKDGSVKPNSTLFSLNPFYHSDNLIRVGGRIANSFYSFDKKHPIILPKNSKLTKLIFEDIHIKYFHCGPTQLLAAVRELYWPVSGKLIAKSVYQKCIICFKAKPKPTHYQMGNLPNSRITQNIPFTHVGLDYAGPFKIKDRITRNPKILKSYVCLFICFSTKALHLEVVSDLTTSCFLDALKRFISRRGKPSHIYSDNAKTFIGADLEMKTFHNFLTENNKVIRQTLISDQIQWHFIPPRAPHFGGIWESGVKSVKHHMKRIMKDHIFTFEKFNTIICQIEGILNSRPLCPLPSADQIEVLTPGHFLILKSPMSAPTEIDQEFILNKPVKQFQITQQIIFHFWNRWRKEYISELQRRSKWKKEVNQPVIQPGDIVIVKDESTPPMKWPLAKVEAVHPGKDGVVRVATIKVDNTIKKRPVIKLCPLPKD